MQTRIPRLDGCSKSSIKYAHQTISTHAPEKSQLFSKMLTDESSPLVSDTSLRRKLVRPSGFPGLNPEISSKMSIRKKFPTNRVNEDPKIVEKVSTDNMMKKILTPEKSSIASDTSRNSNSSELNKDGQIVFNADLSLSNLSVNDERSTTVMDKGAKNSVNQKLAGLQQEFSDVLSVQRSETFICDTDKDKCSDRKRSDNSLNLVHKNLPSNENSDSDPLKASIQNTETRRFSRKTRVLDKCSNLSDPSLPSNLGSNISYGSKNYNGSLPNMCCILQKSNNLEAKEFYSKGENDFVTDKDDSTSSQFTAKRSSIASQSILRDNFNKNDSYDRRIRSSQNLDQFSLQEQMRGNLAAQTTNERDINMDTNDYDMNDDNGHQMYENFMLDQGKGKPRFSFALDLTESTLDCSIELCDVSLSSSAPAQGMSPSLKKQNSFEMDESLGILTPEQMKEFLDSTNTNTNLDLPINVQHQNEKMAFHQMRIDQTPSPEDLPLDPIGVKTDVTDSLLTNAMDCNSSHQMQHQKLLQQCSGHYNVPLQQSTTEVSQTDSDSKTDQMTKSNVSSKVSTSFITSITSITSLDNGYQGDGEMSRPASRGAGEHSPLNTGNKKTQFGRQLSFNNNQCQQTGNVPIRRQDPMTDSDFFTESDADDIFHRGDRRAQVIDGQLYGPMLQPSNVFISEQHEPAVEDSCMESSGIFTDVDNRCDDDSARIPDGGNTVDIDMSPDGSTDTVKSNTNNASVKSSTSMHKIDTSDDHSGGLMYSAVNQIFHCTSDNDANNQTELSSQNRSNTELSSNINNYLNHAYSINNDDYFSHHTKQNNKKLKTIKTSKDNTVNEVCCSHLPEKSSQLPKCNTHIGDGRKTTIITGNVLQATPTNENNREPISVSTKVLIANTREKTAVGLISTPAALTFSPVQKITSFKKHQNLRGSRNEINSETPLSALKKNTEKIFSKEVVPTSIESKISNTNTDVNLVFSKVHNTLKSLSKSEANSKLNTNSPTSRKSSIITKINKPKKFNNFDDMQIKSNKKVINENQENKHPSSSSGVTHKINDNKININKGNGLLKTSSSANNCNNNNNNNNNNKNNVVAGTSEDHNGANNTVVLSSKTRNRWNSVTSKISKSPCKTNYSDVKSKVSTGLALKRSKQTTSSDSISKTSSSHITTNGQSQENASSGSSNCVSRLSSPQMKRISPVSTPPTVKRGRSYRKDSEGSSQSDFSGSPKLYPKSSPLTRTVKKRDARPTTISPTEQELRPKIQANLPSKTKKASPKSQKFVPLAQTSSSSLSPSKGQPNIKKTAVRQIIPQSQAKSATKDKNRVSSHTLAANTEKDCQQHLSENIQTIVKDEEKHKPEITKVTSSSTVTILKQNPLPLQEDNIKNLQEISCDDVDKETTCINENNSRHKEQINSYDPIKEQTSRTQIQSKHQIVFDQIQKNQNQKGSLEIAHANRNVEAFGALIQYLVFELDAFRCPTVKSNYAKAKEHLEETRLLIDEAKKTCHELQDQLEYKEKYYANREDELQKFYKNELSIAEDTISTLRENAKSRIASLEAELKMKDEKHQNNLEKYRSEFELKLGQQENELKAAKQREEELQRRLNDVINSERALQEKCDFLKKSSAEEVQASLQQKEELMEKVEKLTKQLELIKQDTANIKEKEIEKLSSHGKVTVSRRLLGFTDQSAHSEKLTSKNGSTSKIQMLEDEVESLRCVLEIKQNEISFLRKTNQELQKAVEELPTWQMRASTLESRVEDLQIQLQTKTSDEKQLIQRNKHLHEQYMHEVQSSNRLKLCNEQLLYRLKQKGLMSKSMQGHSEYFNADTKAHCSNSNISSNQSNGSRSSIGGSVSNPAQNISGSQRSGINQSSSNIIGCFQMDDISPPTSPMVKGVVEKNDSVSWILEINDDPFEMQNSSVIRRGGSFRSSYNEKSTTKTKRQYSCPIQSLSTSCTNDVYLSKNIGLTNPLTQSASATSIPRGNCLSHHNGDGDGDATNMVALKPVPSRIRSKSVSAKISSPPSTPSFPDCRKIARQNSADPPVENNLVNDIELPFSSSHSSLEAECSKSSMFPINENRLGKLSSSSTPLLYREKKSYNVNSTTNVENIEEYDQDDFLDSSGKTSRNGKFRRNLITCDTSLLTSSKAKKLEIHPSMTSARPSDENFKHLKKCEEIKESAGEAMVSGTNSEDEGCSASSDETVSSDGVTSSLDRRELSIEDALLMDKINASLGGTPMEVSWSDDTDQYPSESVA